MFYAGDEDEGDDVTSGLSMIDPWYLQAPIDEVGEDDESDPEGTDAAADAGEGACGPAGVPVCGLGVGLRPWGTLRLKTMSM
jgi:hypothetical protein